jgi:putative ABC transport system substrate-binding protein
MGQAVGVGYWAAEALNVLVSPLLFANRQVIMERVTALHVPAIYQFPEMAAEGGLIAYGPTLIHMYRELMPRRSPRFCAALSLPDLPVLQPTKFELVVNLKTAKALGLTLHELFLIRADEVIKLTAILCDALRPEMALVV